MKIIEHHSVNQTPAFAPASLRWSRIAARIGILAASLGWILTTETLAVDSSLDVGDWAADSTTRTIQSVLNTAVNIGTFTFDGGTGSLVISVTALGNNWSIAKRYVIPMRNNYYGGTTINKWLKVLPAYDTGPNGGGLNNLDLDINMSGAAMQVRLRIAATDGVSTAVTANIAIESTGVNIVAYPVNPNASSIVVPPAAAQIFGGSVLTQVGGRVGVNAVPAADAALDINGGDTMGLRIRPRSVAGFPTTGTWSQGTLIVDSTGVLYVCVAGGTPGTWKKVGAP